MSASDHPVSDVDQSITPQLASLLNTLVQRLPIHVAVWHLEDPDDFTSFRLVLVNYTSNALGPDLNMREEVGRRIRDILPTIPDMALNTYVEALRTGEVKTLNEVSYKDERFGESILNVQAIPLTKEHLCISVENVTQKKQAEEAIHLAAIQEEIIRTQQEMLAELSTPLIPISDRVMVMPLIGAIDSRRAQQVLESLLQGISLNGTRVVILDITGVPVVDTQIANALIQAAQAVQLLGASIVLTGIRPEVAQTLVNLGADLSSIITRNSLQNGIAYATKNF